MATQTGYKASELGMIPQDWDVEELGAVAKVEMCRRIFKNETLNVGDIPFYKIGTFGGEADAYISRQLFEEYKSKYPYPKIGDVLISAAGTIGRVVVFDGEEAYYQDSNIVWLNINKAKISNSFLYYFYQNTEWNSLEGSTIKRLYNNDLLSKKISIPKSTAEQTAIATALSDTDALISSLQTLIAKKKAIKLSAMQNLLSGKIRLPEFTQRPDGSPKNMHQTELGLLPEDWEVVELGKLTTFINDGTHHTPQYVDSGIPFYSVENITNNDFHNVKYISIEEHNKLIKRCKPEEGDLLLTRIGTLGLTKLIDWDICASIYVSLALLKFKEGINVKYIYEYSKSNLFKNEISKRALLNATPPKINMDQISKIRIFIPKSTTEQTAIAQLLSDMDAEIEALVSRLKKTQSLKQGMMQTLLTGKIRLPLE